MIRFIRIAVFAICTAWSAPLTAQDFIVGLDAYDAGDYAAALESWRPLAEGGDAQAQFGLGFMYRKGNGVSQDDAEALRWYRLAADKGHQWSQYNLGQMYDSGWGVPQDYAGAARWYRLSAEQGNDVAQGALGFMHLTGRGVLKSDVLAHMWFNIASANGSEPAPANRDIAENRMTRDQIAEAQALARVCMSSGYQDCD